MYRVSFLSFWSDDRGAAAISREQASLIPQDTSCKHSSLISQTGEILQFFTSPFGNNTANLSRNGFERKDPPDLASSMAEVGEQKHGNQIATTCVSIISEIDLLDSGQLLHSQKMEAVGQLTGGLAHDFNNLLAVIRGNAEMLEDRLGHDDKALDAIIRSVARGAALTNRLLTFSRQPQLNAGPFDLAELIAGMLQLLSRTLGETIEIETRADPDLWLAVAEADQAENAFLNLAINARDAMPEGGKLTIECQNARLDDAYVAENPEATAGDYVMLAVSDQGTGMSAQVLANAFKPFFTTKEIGQGSGLGLSMIHGFAKQSGGHATIQSEIGDGTTVRLYLPRHIGMADR